MGWLLDFGKSLWDNSIGAVTNAFGNFIDGALDYINPFGSRYQASEARHNYRLQQDINWDYYQKQFALQKGFVEEQNEYNTPANQKQRLTEAGINPFVLNGLSQGMSPGMAQASGLPISNGAASYRFNSEAQQALSTARAADAASRYSNVLSDTTKGLVDSQIKTNLSQAGLNDVLKDLNNIEAQFRGKRLDADIKKVFAEINELVQRVYLERSSQQVNEAEVDKKISETLLNYAKKHLTYKQVQELEINIQHLAELLRSQIKANNSAANQSNATARNQNAQANTENVLRPDKKDLVHNQAQLAKQDYEYYKKIADTRVKVFEKELDKVGLSVDMLTSQIDKLERENKFIEARELSALLKQSVETITTLVPAANIADKASKFAKALSDKYKGYTPNDPW